MHQKEIKDMAVYGMPKEQFKGESPYPQSRYMAEMRNYQKEFNKKMSKYVDKLRKEYEYIKGREIIYVKGCDGFWLYERRSGIRGARINGTNHDKTEHFVINNRNVEIGLFLTKHKELEL